MVFHLSVLSRPDFFTYLYFWYIPSKCWFPRVFLTCIPLTENWTRMCSACSVTGNETEEKKRSYTVWFVYSIKGWYASGLSYFYAAVIIIGISIMWKYIKDCIAMESRISRVKFSFPTKEDTSNTPIFLRAINHYALLCTNFTKQHEF